MIMAFTFYLMHQAIYLLIARGMAGEVVTFAWTRLLLGAFANALMSVPLFAILDRFKIRT
jgi:hypothetical protein